MKISRRCWRKVIDKEQNFPEKKVKEREKLRETKKKREVVFKKKDYVRESARERVSERERERVCVELIVSWFVVWVL